MRRALYSVERIPIRRHTKFGRYVSAFMCTYMCSFTHTHTYCNAVVVHHTDGPTDMPTPWNVQLCRIHSESSLYYVECATAIPEFGTHEMTSKDQKTLLQDARRT